MTSGPSAGNWARTPPSPNAPDAPASAANAPSWPGPVSRRTPVDAVAMGSFMNTGNRSQPVTSPGVASTAPSGCGSPAAVSVAFAEILSCTWASAANGGTAVRTPASRSRPGQADSTATCSWVGNNTSAAAARYTASAAASQPSGSAP